MNEDPDAIPYARMIGLAQQAVGVIDMLGQRWDLNETHATIEGKKCTVKMTFETRGDNASQWRTTVVVDPTLNNDVIVDKIRAHVATSIQESS